MKYERPKMLKSTNWILICALLTSACATAPSVQVSAVCPRLPDLEKLPPDALEKNYSVLIRNFLAGSLVTPTKQELPSTPVTSSTTK